MTRCERMEVLISALLDGEAAAAEQRAALDHLLDCPDCRRFYQEASALQARLDLLAPAALPLAAPAHWRRVASARHWLPAAALVAALALGAALGARLGAGPRLALPAGTESFAVALGSDRDALDDREFLALTLRLLRADPRYHRELAAVLAQLAPPAGGREATGGDFELTSEPVAGEESAGGARAIY
ncbi:hypothetical protein FJ251_05855 [bacterium]|nr:hypothetical protein [bacterium]